MGRWLDRELNPWGDEVLQGISLELMQPGDWAGGIIRGWPHALVSLSRVL